MKSGTVVYQGVSKAGKSILIRYVMLEDVQIMLDFINTLSKEQTYISFQGEQMLLEEEEKYVNDIVPKIENNEAIHLLAFSDDKLIGGSDIHRSNKKFDRHVGIFGITIAKDFRGEGIGSMLMSAVMKEAMQNIPSLSLISLALFGNNETARSMYEKFGFVEYGRLPKGIVHKGEYVDHVYMYKDLER